MNTGKGRLEVICGSMFSGKSEELIRRLKRAQFAQQNVIAIKHIFDDSRTTTEFVVSHNGSKLAAFSLENPHSLVHIIPANTDVVGIDEVQFFTSDIVNVICQLVDKGIRVIAAGLDLDFRGHPFGCMPVLMAVADDVTKLKAICICCGADAHYSQRLVNGNPAKYNDPIVMVGAQEAYQPRCRNCHQIDQSAY